MVTSVEIRRQRRQKKQRSRRRLFAFGIVTIIAIGLNFTLGYGTDFIRELVPNKTTDETSLIVPQMADGMLAIDESKLHSSNVILVNLTDKEIIYEKHAGSKLYPASLTKIMTAIIAIEQIPELKQQIGFSPGLFSSLAMKQASMAGFEENEEVAAIDLLYGTLLASGAEASIGLAEYISGSEKEFAKLMNQKAEELGMNHTRFSNATGLHDSKHYSTAEDLALLLEYALKDSTFRTIFTTSNYTTYPTNLNPSGISITSTLFKRAGGQYEFTGGKILGGKTGYTSEAGLCLATLAEKNGKEYILITTNADGSNYSEPFHFQDAIYIYEQMP